MQQCTVEPFLLRELKYTRELTNGKRKQDVRKVKNRLGEGSRREDWWRDRKNSQRAFYRYLFSILELKYLCFQRVCHCLFQTLLGLFKLLLEIACKFNTLCAGATKAAFYWDMIPVNNQNSMKIPTWWKDRRTPGSRELMQTSASILWFIFTRPTFND